VQQYAYRDYCHRVDIFHLLNVFEKHGLKATAAMDALTPAARQHGFLLKVGGKKSTMHLQTVMASACIHAMGSE
jgi:hypothetical protein